MNKNSAADEAVKRFALIGAAGYVAPRHLKAISDLGQSLVTAMMCSTVSESWTGIFLMLALPWMRLNFAEVCGHLMLTIFPYVRPTASIAPIRRWECSLVRM